MSNRLILVAGSGRSGTSLFAGILKAIGGHVPQPEVTSDNTNPQGFGEPRWVVDLHTRLLKRVGVHTSDARPSAWASTAEIGRDWDVQAELGSFLQKEFKQGDHVVIKDPRLLWFIPLWRRVGEMVATPCFVTPLRHPLEVIKSKQTYYGENFHPNNRVVGWLNTMLYTERATRGSRRALVRYDDLLADPTKALADVSQSLDLELIERAGPTQMREAARLVDPSLRRARATWDSLEVDERLVRMAEDVWSVFDSAAAEGNFDDGSVSSDLDRFREQYVSLYEFAESVAESSISAAQKAPVKRGPKRGARSNAADPPVSTKRAVKRLGRRVKRRGRQTLFKLRTRKGQSSDAQVGNPPSVPSGKQ